ncbi:11050_t:CDS:2, partial [Funneliformis mosseae]
MNGALYYNNAPSSPKQLPLESRVNANFDTINELIPLPFNRMTIYQLSGNNMRLSMQTSVLEGSQDISSIPSAAPH